MHNNFRNGCSKMCTSKRQSTRWFIGSVYSEFNHLINVWCFGILFFHLQVINYMIYNRGNPRDFDDWARAGNEGWSYKEVLPYFLKSERANLRGLENSPFHNRRGKLSVEHVPWRSKIAKAFVLGSKQLGHRETDYNSDQQLGVAFVQATTLRGI